MRHTIGLDLGGSNIAAGVVDEALRITARAKRKTPRTGTAEELCQALEEAAQAAAEAAGLSLADISWAGIGSPGTIDPNADAITYTGNLMQLTGYPLKGKLRERLGLPVYLENDANAAALGEYFAGALKGAKTAIAVTLGTGVGSGILLDGRLYYGSRFGGGELGHMCIERGGLSCTCGRRGCWECYAAAPALVRLTKEAIAASPSSMLAQLGAEHVSGRTSFEAMRHGCPVGRDVVNHYLDDVACGLANIVNIFQPERICLGGGVSNEGESLLEPLQTRVAALVQGLGGGFCTELRIAELGNDAGILGAALLGDLPPR